MLLILKELEIKIIQKPSFRLMKYEINYEINVVKRDKYFYIKLYKR